MTSARSYQPAPSFRIVSTFGALALVVAACGSEGPAPSKLRGGGAGGGRSGLDGGSGLSGGAGMSGAQNGSGGSAGVTGAAGGASGGGSTGTPSGAGGGGGTGSVSGGTADGGTTEGGKPSVSGASGTSGASGGASGGAVGGSAGGGASGGTAQGGAGVGGTAAGGMSGAGGTAGASSGPPSVRVVGRTVASTNGVRFAWPGVSVTARFSGTQASIQLNDGGNRNRFTVVVDNGTPTTFTTASGTTKYPLATGLPNGEHQVVVWRNTESYGGVTEFVDISDFGSGGMLLAPPATPAHRIEVIGDSISCGAGVEGTSASCTTDNFTNNYLAYASIAARTLGVDLFTIAYSGIGVYRSYTTGGTPPPVMIDRYDHAITNDGSAWDFSKYTPDAVVINLGSNDWSAGDPGQPYIDKYVSFIAHVRSKYASAKIVCVIQNSNAVTAINSVVTKAKGDGDMNVEAFDIHSYANGNACAGHPDKAGQAAMGAALASHLKSVLGW